MDVIAYIGEIRLFAGDRIPEGWLICDGRLMNASEYHMLSVAIGTTYGGDGHSNFALPNLKGRVPVHIGNKADTVQLSLGLPAGNDTFTITTAHTPPHKHKMYASSVDADSDDPKNNFLAKTKNFSYGITDPGVIQPMNNLAVAATGADAIQVSTVQNYQAINYIIAFEGSFSESAPAS